MYLCFRCIDGASFYLNWDLDYLGGKQMYYIVRPSPLRFFDIFFFRGVGGRDITDIFVPHIIRTIHYFIYVFLKYVVWMLKVLQSQTIYFYLCPCIFFQI
jgi:hypothetical protein